jgi:single-strand DNA-binding protein
MVNKWIGIGNLGRDAELRFTPGGSPVATFSIGCSEKWKDRAGKLQERTEWVRIVLWGKVAESLSPYLIKGKQVYVEGKISTRKWQGKDGRDNYTTEIKADQIRLLGGKGAANGRRQAPASQSPVVEDDAFLDGDLDGGGLEPIAEPAAAGGDLTDDDIPF